MSTELTGKQKIILSANASRKDNTYIVSKREEGQLRFITCPVCETKFDLEDSVEYGAAIAMFKARDGLCVGCHYKKTGDLVY